MGVYIPPGKGSNDKDSETSKKDSLWQRSSGDQNKVIFYNRPSVGLKIWGPLVPASDYLPGLYSLTALQTIFGLVMIKNVRKIWEIKTPFARFSKLLSTLASGYLLFNSGLEVSRLTLPYDPWFEQAREARLKAKSEGKKVNFWFGPWDLKPITFKEWNTKVDSWIMKTESDYEKHVNREISDHSDKSVQSVDFSSASQMVHQAYLDTKSINQRRQSEILEQLQHIKSFQEMLPNYQVYDAFTYDRVGIKIPSDNHLEDDFDLDEVWELNDPWTALGYETSPIVKFIPRFRWIDSSPHTPESSPEPTSEQIPSDSLDSSAL